MNSSKNNNNNDNNPSNVKLTAIKSSPWTSDDQRQQCTSCSKPFDNFFNRRHHCRLCGDIFCHDCSFQRSLIPPSSIVLQPTGGKKVRSNERRRRQQRQMAAAAARHDVDNGDNDGDDPDRVVTYAKTIVEKKKNDNITSARTKTKCTNVNRCDASVDDEMSLSTVHIHENNTDHDHITEFGKEDLDGDCDISQSISGYGLDPPSLTLSHSKGDLNNEQKIEGKGEGEGDDDNNNNNEDEKKDNENDATLRSPSLDDDLSFSVATSTGFSYASLSERQTQEPQDQHNIRKDQNETIPEDPPDYYQINPNSSNISTSTSTSTFADRDMDSYEHMQSSSTILYGKGLEERMKLAREPLRVCAPCHHQLHSIQEELRMHNSNAMKYNSIDPTNIRRLLNSPLAFTLGHEIRKAAYTLNNLLPMPKRMGAFTQYAIGGGFSAGAGGAGFGSFANPGHGGDEMGCDTKDTCKNIVGNFGNVDGVRIPAKLLEMAKGVAVLTSIKTGVGIAGVEFGTGLVVTRLSDDNYWSPPCAIGTAGVSWGALVGVQLSDHVFLLMSDEAVDMFVNNNEGSFQLGADVGVAVGPLGRSFEADVGATGGNFAPIYTYSLSKGLYAGISLDGKVMVTRHRVNEKFYGRKIDPKSLLNGDVPTPPAAQPLYDALKRCHVYASSSSSTGGVASLASRRQQAYMSVHNNPYGDNNLPTYELEEEYNMRSRHYGP
jgi:lipid-binding SYLF domain-containing protein